SRLRPDDAVDGSFARARDAARVRRRPERGRPRARGRRVRRRRRDGECLVGGKVALARDSGPADPDPMRFDNPLLVRWEYASEERLVKRNNIFRNVVAGDNPEEVSFQAVAEAKPGRGLDGGCGPGDITERFAKEVGAEGHTGDISPRMVELTRARGIDAQIADAEQLPFGDREFDCVFAGWVLYHVPDVGQAIKECARVLTANGRLVASVFCSDNISELWDLILDAPP